jgi:nucleoside phosphorylase
MASIRGVTTLGLLFAMYREVPAIFGRPMPWMIRSHILGGRHIHIVVTGIGTWNARRAARRVCNVVRPDYLMCLGFCGAAREGIEIGDLIVADRVANARQEIPLPNASVDSCLMLMERNVRWHRGKLQTVRSHALSRVAVAGDCLAVDMEAFAIADVASEYGIPAIIVKAVSDKVPERPSVKSAWSFMRTRTRAYRIARATLEEFIKSYLRSDAGVTVSTGEALLLSRELREDSLCP